MKLYKKYQVTLHRHRHAINWAVYMMVLGCMLLVLWDPQNIELFFPFLKVVERDEDQFLTTTTLRPTLSVKKLMGFPFVPKEFACEDMFIQAGHNFTYPEWYWDHADAYKGALQMNDIIEEGVANEHSWIITELGALKFVKTVCETGFNAGHNTFHWLTAQEDSIVHSFDRADKNYSIEMSDFMSIEFPDRFFGYAGDPKVTLPKFVQQNMNKTLCDMIFIDSAQDKESIRSNFMNFRKLANSFENVVVMDAHPKNIKEGDVVWQEMLKHHVITEHFRCYFQAVNDGGTMTNQRGMLVGSFVA